MNGFIRGILAVFAYNTAIGIPIFHIKIHRGCAATIINITGNIIRIGSIPQGINGRAPGCTVIGIVIRVSIRVYIQSVISVKFGQFKTTLGKLVLQSRNLGYFRNFG